MIFQILLWWGRCFICHLNEWHTVLPPLWHFLLMTIVSAHVMEREVEYIPGYIPRHSLRSLLSSPPVSLRPLFSILKTTGITMMYKHFLNVGIFWCHRDIHKPHSVDLLAYNLAGTSRVCEFHITCQLLCYASGGDTNSLSHVLHMGVSHCG